jgi:uncharacterized spore protein YtfJ
MTTQHVVHTAPIEKLVEKLSVETVFGKPVSEGGVTIIPVAQVNFGFGYGGGYGRAPSNGQAGAAEGDAPTSNNEGSGSGGGAGGRATPRGFLRFTPDGVNYEPSRALLQVVPLS